MATTVNIKMFRFNELGDCFLLTFRNDNTTRRMLIDCGSFRNSAASKTHMKKIVGAIKAEAGGNGIDVVVATHQHNDHVSGFLHCSDDFETIGVGQVWLSWLDNPRDKVARDVAEEHKGLLRRLQSASQKLAAMKSDKAQKARGIVDDMLGFTGALAGAAPQVPADAIKFLKRVGTKPPRYLKPGEILGVPGVPEDAVRVYVFGPPRDDEWLYRKDPRKGESYDHALSAAHALSATFLAALDADSSDDSRYGGHYPFHQSYKRNGRTAGKDLRAVMKRYKDSAEKRRTIDDDWVQQAERLALYMDEYTNNSSLVLAIELVESNKVLLFVGDAQTGNWLSWDTIKWKNDTTVEDLLGRTVFYKVGHHASHNATLVAAFEKMVHPDLAAFIPVHKQDPNIKKKGGWKMPARKLFKELAARTSNRVLQMDDVNPASCDLSKAAVKKAWKQAGLSPKVNDLYIEVTVKG